MKIRQHKESGLWVSDDGRVIMPPCLRYPHYRFTYGCNNGKGYFKVIFKGRGYYIHRLVAETYIPNPHSLSEVDHIDRNPGNNASSNLRWVDRKTQCSNMQKVDDALARYGVRHCNDKKAYQRAYREEHHEELKIKKAAYRAEHLEECRARNREWRAKQKALGKRERKCPDGKRRMLTDEEYNERYKKEPTCKN